MGLYLPGTQSVQALSLPVQPASHTHEVTAVPPAGETEFAGQATQSPIPDPYVPALQTQMPDTGTLEIESLPQTMHVKPSPRNPSLQVVHTKLITLGGGGRAAHLFDAAAGTHEHTQTSQLPCSLQKSCIHSLRYQEHWLSGKLPRPIKKGSTQGAGAV